MAKRMILMLGVTVVLLGGLGFMKFKQVEAAMQAGASFQPPPEAVTSIVAQRDQWPATMGVIGTMEAVHGVTVSADLPGVVERISFESGQSVSTGDVLVELDTRQERAQLASLEAQSELARVNYGRMQQLVNAGVISRMDYDQATSQQKATEANVAEIRATIARKTIRAPFSGILGIRKVNLGQYLAAGAPMVVLQSLNPIYVDFGVPQQTAAQVKVGSKLRVASEDLAGHGFTGRVTALDSVIDETTRNVQVQATLANPEGKLRPGMFVQVDVGVGASRAAITLPASAISYAPYGDSVFVITDLKDPKGKTYRGVRQQFVKLEGSRGDQVAVISGVNPGDEVVTSGVFKLRNGAAVQVNNKVQPGNNPAPKPEDS
ncbi:MAG TPA: efflux RND transporter periplasmic adaptor subunit [Candidatus Acidoferrum sp.]|jgi:membrane fusion protein (multidrug efflux system)|nr:efflux RND transporter periplasmic adaptor subunit [Candidatus Acidoferrum sp.]